MNIKYKIFDNLFLLTPAKELLYVKVESIRIFSDETYYYVSGKGADADMAYREDMFYTNQNDAIINLSK